MRIVRAGIAVVLSMFMVVGCGAADPAGTGTPAASSRADSSAAMPTKRLVPGKPCDLIPGEEIAKIIGKNLNKQFPPMEEEVECSYPLSSGLGVTLYRGLPGSTSAKGKPTKIGRFSGTKQEYSETCALFLPLDRQGGSQVLGAAATMLPSDRLKSCAASEKVVLAMYERLP